MASPDPTTLAARRGPAQRIARRYTFALLAIGLASVLAAIPLWRIAAGPATAAAELADPFYIALAIECAVWGLIDALLACLGLLSRPRSDDDAFRTRTLGALRFSGRMNVGWLLVGGTLVALGYHFWSASLCGHGAGVLVQAFILIAFDGSFARGLRETSTHGPR